MERAGNWLRQHGVLVASVAGLLLVAVVAAWQIKSIDIPLISEDRTPHMGDSCGPANESEVEAWVDANQDAIPDGVDTTLVAIEVHGICSVAYNTNTPQDFSPGLLHNAVELATEEEWPEEEVEEIPYEYETYEEGYGGYSGGSYSPQCDPYDPRYHPGYC